MHTMHRVVLWAFIGVLCFYGATAGICAPNQYNTGYTLVQNEVGETGRFAVDFTTNQLAANVSGIDNTGTAFNGTFVFTNGVGWWYEAALQICHQSNPPSFEFFMTQCLKPGGTYQPITIAGHPATLYKYETPGNGTAVVFTDIPELPVSYQFLYFGGPTTPVPNSVPYIQSVTYLDTQEGVEASWFTVPSYCQSGDVHVKAFEALPIHQSLRALLWVH